MFDIWFRINSKLNSMVQHRPSSKFNNRAIQLILFLSSDWLLLVIHSSSYPDESGKV